MAGQSTMSPAQVERLLLSSGAQKVRDNAGGGATYISKSRGVTITTAPVPGGAMRVTVLSGCAC